MKSISDLKISVKLILTLSPVVVVIISFLGFYAVNKNKQRVLVDADL